YLNKARFYQLSSFIPACSTSPDFSQWTIKPYNLNTILSNEVDPDSEDYSVFQDISNSRFVFTTFKTNVNSKQTSSLELADNDNLIKSFADLDNQDINFETIPLETFNYRLTDLNNTHDRSSSTFSQVKLNHNFEKQSNNTSIESKEHRVLSEDAMINQKSAEPNKKQSNNIKK
ncbi:9271_t:CDS:2, partial [Funneliformis caledonium]